MMNNDEIVALLNSLTIRSYKHATNKEAMRLTTHQANALGMKSRNLLRIVKVAIQAIADKMFVERLESDGDTQPVEDWLSANRFENLQRDLYKLVVRDAVAYVQVKFENNIPTLALIESYDGRTGATSYYDPATKQELFVVNVWYSDTQNVDIYYPDRIEKYTFDTDAGMWKPRQDIPNEVLPIDWTDNNNAPLGIALVRFDITESDIVEATQLQTDINEAILDMLATSRNQGWPQRVLRNASQETYLLNDYNTPILDYATSYPIPRKIELTPGSILMLQGADSSLEQLDNATPDTTVLETLRSLLSQVTTVPTHYFNGEWPSGFALINSEMRLNHKVEAHNGQLTPAYETMFALMMKVSNTFAATSYDANIVVSVEWTSPEVWTEDLKIEMRNSAADYVMKLRTAGVISVEQSVRTLHEDWDETQIANEVARIQAENSIAGI